MMQTYPDLYFDANNKCNTKMLVQMTYFVCVWGQFWCKLTTAGVLGLREDDIYLVRMGKRGTTIFQTHFCYYMVHRREL